MNNWIAAILVGVVVFGGIYLIKGMGVSADPTDYLPSSQSQELLQVVYQTIQEETGWEDFTIEETAWTVDQEEHVSLVVATVHDGSAEVFLLYIELGGEPLTAKVVRRLEQ